jgi:hypothetical protein
VSFLVGDRQLRPQDYTITASGEADKLPIAGEIRGDLVDREILDENTEQPLV